MGKFIHKNWTICQFCFVTFLSRYTAAPADLYIPDMIHYGLIFEGRALAIQYGDGECLVEFWRDSLHWYNLRCKVQCMWKKLSLQESTLGAYT